jgi:hypothetical protein
MPKVDRWAKHPALQPFDVAGEELPSRLFLVRTRGELPELDGVVVHGVHNGVFLVSGDPNVVRDLARSGCAVILLYESPVVPVSAARDWVRIDAPDPHIEAMVAEVDWAGVSEKIQWLVDYGTRYSYAPNHRDVADSISGRLASYGLQATLRSFEFAGRTLWNVEATQTGTLYPNSFVIICGHFDSISRRPLQTAPGADDNATGIAAVLSAAEILSRHSFEHSIRYLCFGGEEQGLRGSYAYAGWARWIQQLDIVGVLNFDMVGYWEPGADKDLEIETNHASQWLAEAVVNAADLYTDTPYELHVYDGAWWSDHASFWQKGYAAVNHEEAWDWYDPDFNPHYHTARDLPKYLDPDFTVGNIQVGVAALATLAGVARLPVSFDMRPGSCRNPFNPKSQGVIPALVFGSAEFDVRHVDVGSLQLEGSVSPLTTRVADMGATRDDQGHPCADMSPDGFVDLRLTFSTPDIAAILGPIAKGDTVRLHLIGQLVDGTEIWGDDVVVVVGNTGKEPKAALSLATQLTNTGRAVHELGLPELFELYQNAPNPFNPATHIRFDVPLGDGAMTLRIYDVSGRLVRTLVNGAQMAGQKTVTWDGRNEAGNAVATGIYLYRLTGPGFERTRKMVLLR